MSMAMYATAPIPAQTHRAQHTHTNEHLTPHIHTAIPGTVPPRLSLSVPHTFHARHGGKDVATRPITFHTRMGAQAGDAQGSHDGRGLPWLMELKRAVDEASPSLPVLGEDDAVIRRRLH